MARLKTRLRVLGSAAVVALGALVPVTDTAAAAAEPYEWVAMGDSYTAGIFAGPVERPRDGCERTADAYPNVVARNLRAQPPGESVQLVNVSCGAATIANIAMEPQTPIGIGYDDPQRPPDGWPEVPPQLEAAGPDTDVITIGIGGNSLPFGGMLAECLQRGADRPTQAPCREYYETDPPSGVETIDEKYARIALEYREMLTAVHAKAPLAQVITVGYPSVLPEDPADCRWNDLTEFGTITRQDITWLRGVLERLNAIIADTTADHGDTYADTYTSSLGHDACQPREVKWVEGIVGAPEGETRLTLVHPNSKGHANAAEEVEQAIRSVLP